MATVFRNSRRVLAALRRCLPLALIGLAAPWLGAADLPLSVGTYRPATQARNDHYTLTVTLAPPAGSRALSAVDLAFAVVDVDDYARFAWDAQGYTLERHRDGVAAVLCRGTAPLPPSLARGGAVEIRCRAHVLEVVGPSGRLARVLNPGLGRGALASRTGPGQAEVAGTSYQRVEPFTFGDDFMRTEEEAADLGLWQPASGQWRLYSVMERIHANPDARIREGREPDASRSPNPFSLSGTGPDGALILTGQAFWSDYEVAVSVRSFQSDVGLVFAARDAETHWLVRWGLHSLGLRPALLELIERRQGQERLLASATVTGRAEAWYRLAVRQCGDDIRVLVDDVEVLRQRDATCRGGRIGLYARGTHETYFDDVSVRSLDSLELDTPALLGADAWQPRSGDWAMDAGSGECRFTGHGQRGWGDATTAVATLGWAAWPAQRFETTVEAAADAAFGLAVGYRDDGSHLRILWQRQDGGRVSVSRVGAGETSLLAETACALPADRPVHLAVDTRDGVLRIQSDDVTRLRLRPSPDAADLAGPVGLVVAGRSPATFSACRLFAEADENWEAPAAVERFADDPYMQGWASTRFAWQRLRPEAAAEDFPQRFVHQGDFYGAFRIRAPVQDRLAFFFGLDEVQPGRGYSLETRVDPDAGTGMITLSRERRTLAQARFVPGPRQVLPGQQMVDEKIGTRPRTPDTESYGTLELHRDGQAIWASIDGHELFCISDPEPLTGRSLGLQVPAPLDFIHIAAERAQVIDELFERAAVDWTPVGQWEVTNRFACDPRWSHMNGSSMGVAALWSKFAFAGDFTLEYYAGMRMRQEEMMEGADRMYYPRVGDINVAMASRPGEIFSGYNLLITAWDPMWTETTSRLYRLDEVLATSDLELVPRGRHRSPKARAIEVDWDPGGRPVHGAWYFVKLRRTGPRLEAWFDNVLVFSAVDPEPLTPERLALWTQHNSIVIARAKISYRQCRRVVDIGAAPPAPATPTPPQAAAPPAPLPELRVVTHPGKALEFEDGDDGVTPWNGDQSVEITRVARADQGQALRLENLHGGGDAGVRLPFHGVDLGRDVVLEMDAAVEPGAQVNLYLAWADLPAELAFVPLTGPREEAPNRARLGPADGIPADGRWHPLRWDLGRWARQRFPWRSSYRVAWVMVGMLHEGYLNAGLGGNPAGAIYHLDAIRLHDAGGRAVGVTWGDEAATAWHWRAWLSRQPDAPPPATAEALTAPSVRLEADGTGTWFVHAEQLGGETPRRLPPRPIEVGEAVAIAATTPAPDQPWDGDRVSIVLSEAPGHPDLTHARLTIAGNAVPINAATTTYDPATRRLDMRVLYSGDGLPDQSAVELRFAAADALAGSVSLDSAGRPRPPSHDIDHAWKARLDYASDRRGPTVALTGDLVRRLTFNRGLDDVTLVAPPREARLNTVTGADGSPALELSNHVCGSTFNAAFALGDIPIGRYPRLAFDYRVDGYTQCDLMFQMGGQRLTVGFTDGDDSARLLVGAVPGVVRDGAWHRAEVDLSMVRPRGFQRSFSAPGVVSEFGLGDWVYPSNAPGARVAVDNLEMVPTVGTAARPLELTWAAHDLSGVNAFSYVWDQEPLTEPDDEPETGEARASFTALPSGEAFFHVRARDGAGNWGETTHARFLIDNDPPTPVEIDPAPGAAVAAEKLRVRFAPSLAGLDPAALTLSVQGQAQPARGGAASWDAERGEFTFDLLSYGGLLRGLVEDGTEISVALSDVRDAAGNTMAPLAWSWKVAYSADRQPPLPPRLWTPGVALGTYEHFADGIGPYWRAYGTDDSEIEVTTVARPDVGACLQVRKVGAAQRFAVYRSLGRLQPRKTPRLSFDYCLSEGTRINLLFMVNREWRQVTMTGSDRLPVLGAIPEARADGRWRHAELDLEALFKAAFPDQEEPDVRLMAFGEWGVRNDDGSTLWLDNIALLGPSGAAPMVRATAADATGIRAWRLGFSRDPLDQPTAETPAQQAPALLAAADAPGLWYIHAQAQDGAGNWGEILHYPYLCHEPIANDAENGLESGAPWRVRPGRRNSSGYAFTCRGSGANEVLGVQMAMQASCDMEISRTLTAELTAATVVEVDLFIEADEALPVAASARTSARDDGLVIGERQTLEPGRWHRGVRLRFPPAALRRAGAVKDKALRIREFGLVVTPPRGARLAVLADRLRLDGKLALP